ncbi:uncharacterized protein Hap1MRO34_014137 [Clarias gariepinus]
MDLSPLPVMLLLILLLPAPHAEETPRPVLSVSPQSWVTEGDSVTLICEVKNSSTDWTFSWYREVPYRENNVNTTYKDSSRGFRGSYTFSPAALKQTGVYTCKAERHGQTIHSNSQALWITGESPPVSMIINPSRTQHFTYDSLSLSCEDQSHSTGWTVRRYTDSGGVTDCLGLGSVTGSTCTISSIKKPYTGVYWCESESGETSNPVNITVDGSEHGNPTVTVAAGLGVAVLFIISFVLIILLWCRKKKKEKQPKTNQTSEQNQRRSGAEDSQSGPTPLQAGEDAAESGEVTYEQLTKNKKTNGKKDVDAEPSGSDVTYVELEMKQKKTTKIKTEQAGVDADTVYSEVKLNTE